jgi:hypothetical protein
MGSVTNAMCTSFKVELMTATHNFTASTGNAFKIALIKATPTGDYGAATTNYSNLTGASDETSGTGYTAGGVALTNVTPTSSSTTAFTDFSNDPTWTSATFSSDGALIYNTSSSNRSVCVLTFGGTKTVTSGSFVIQFPTANSTDAIIRIA